METARDSAATAAATEVRRAPEGWRLSAAYHFLRCELEGVPGWRITRLASLAVDYWRNPRRYD